MTPSIVSSRIMRTASARPMISETGGVNGVVCFSMFFR
jgi:hypothetical protein